MAAPYLVISHANDGPQLIIAAVPGKRIRVTQYVIVVDEETGVCFFADGGGVTALTGNLALTVNGGVSSGYCPDGLFETPIGAGLYLDTNNVYCGGHLRYEVV